MFFYRLVVSMTCIIKENIFVFVVLIELIHHRLEAPLSISNVHFLKLENQL